MTVANKEFGCRIQDKDVDKQNNEQTKTDEAKTNLSLLVISGAVTSTHNLNMKHICRPVM